MSALNQTVYLVQNGQVIETTIGECDGYIDETTTPNGVAPRLHVRGKNVWTWGHGGNFPNLVREFDTEEEARAALEDTFVYDFWKCPDILAFKTREAAEKLVREIRESNL